jgi:hypothetical protein
MAKDLPDNVKTLLQNILDWMIENDYECGPRGAQLSEEIMLTLGIIGY